MLLRLTNYNTHLACSKKQQQQTYNAHPTSKQNAGFDSLSSEDFNSEFVF